MKREIKFRGKAKNGGEWVYSTTISQGTIKRKMYDWFMEVGENKWKGVVSETLGMFTGAHDKFARPIYEGDILYDSSIGRYGIVRWANFGFSFGVRILDCHNNPVSEVAGNIHDNPEMVENIEYTMGGSAHSYLVEEIEMF